MLSLDSCPVRNPHIAWRIVDGQAVLVDGAAGEMRVFNDVGSQIWDLADGQRSIEQIASRLVAEYEVALSEARQDVLEFVTKLCEEGLMQLPGDMPTEANK